MADIVPQVVEVERFVIWNRAGGSGPGRSTR